MPEARALFERATLPKIRKIAENPLFWDGFPASELWILDSSWSRANDLGVTGSDIITWDVAGVGVFGSDLAGLGVAGSDGTGFDEIDLDEVDLDLDEEK